MLPSATSANEGWHLVGRKKGKGKGKRPGLASSPTSSITVDSAPDPSLAGGKKKTVSKAEGSQPILANKEKNKAKIPAAKKQKMIPPKTVAVVFTLTEEAIKKGETYMSVLCKARSSIDIQALGIQQARMGQTMTGARKFEFPGTDSASQADKFAKKLQEVVADMARVSRPQKYAGLIISGLDDSVIKTEVAEKVAEIGGCTVESVKIGEIRPGRGGVGAVRLQCPVVAAKAVLEGGRFLVGFSSATVRALEDRPLRCFRCFALGHTRALCPSPKERSDLCFRCGISGHKVATCNSKLHCAVCAESGRSADHVMGGKKCNPPKKKGKVLAPIQPTTNDGLYSTATEESAMSD